MNCLGDLNVKAQQGEVYLDSIIKICTFLKEFVREDLLATLEGKELLVWILEVETKISFSLQFMHALNDQRDITNSPKDYYEATWRRILINPLGEQEAAAGYKFLKKMLFITTAASIKEEEFELSLFRKTCFGCSFPRYLLAADDCKLQSFKFYRQPTIQLAQKIWNIPECGATK